MGTAINQVAQLTHDEVVILDHLKLVLKSLGVKAVLTRTFAQIRVNDGDILADVRVLNMYLSDIDSTDSRDMYLAGVSLQEVVDLANETGIFPEDFLPSQETVDKCVDGFWAMHR